MGGCGGRRCGSRVRMRLFIVNCDEGWWFVFLLFFSELNGRRSTVDNLCALIIYMYYSL